MSARFQIGERAADVSTAVSAAGFAITLANVSTIVSIVSGIAATITAICAARYYLKKAQALDAKKAEDTD